MQVIAHNIRSMYNVGSIFRNCAAFGVEKLYLTGITAQPPRKEIAKVALGAQDMVPWEGGDIKNIITKARAEGFKIYGLDNTPNSQNIQEIFGEDKIMLILGNEVDGIDEETLALTDGAVEIPMEDKKSLNVSVASGVAFYAIKQHI